LIDRWLAEADERLIFLSLIALFAAAAEIGYRLAARRRAELDEASTSQAATIQAAVLGLLALLLGFTFAMAVSRFEARARLVTDEANAIGTSVLRARLLPEPQRTNATRLLRSYVDHRIAFHEASGSAYARDGLAEKTAALQDALWGEAAAAAALDPRSVPFGLFLTAINDVIDVAGRQDGAARDRVPAGVFGVLALVAVIAVAFVGYGPGVPERRNLRVTLLVSLLFATVIMLIVDLDRPTSGLVRVSPRGLLDLKAGLDRAGP
jgi:hypothetical protein